MTTAKRTTLLKKITLSEVFGLVRSSGGFKPKAHFDADENGNFAPVLIMRVAGIVHGYDIGTTNYGEYKKFKGNIAAINRHGNEFRSPYAILPAPADDLTAEMIDTADGKPVEFAFDILAVQDSSDRGYKFEVQPLMQKPQGDPLDAIVNQVSTEFALPNAEAATIEKIENKPAENVAAKVEGKANADSNKGKNK